MAANRERRPNAGSKIAELLENDTVDDFYREHYGGFYEVKLFIYYCHDSSTIRYRIHRCLLPFMCLMIACIMHRRRTIQSILRVPIARVAILSIVTLIFLKGTT